MKILITGASGFLGSRVLDDLSPRNTVIGVDVVPNSTVDVVLAGVESEEFISLCKGFQPDVIVHLAGKQFTKPVPPWRRDEYFQINTAMATNIGKAIEFVPKIKQLVFVSTDMVYGRPGSTILNSSAVPAPLGPYGQSKLASEHILESFARVSGVKLCIFRPRLIIGPGRKGTIGVLSSLISKGLPVPVIGDGTNVYQMVSVANVAEAIRLAIESSKSGIFNLGSSSPPIVNDLLRHAILATGSKSRLIHLPKTLTLAGLRILDRFGLSPLSPEQFELASLNYVLDVSDTLEQLGWANSETDSDMLLAAIESNKGAR